MNDPYNPYEAGKPQKIEVGYRSNRSSSKKSGIGAVNAGGAIVIIIFVVLCLTIFGLLAFATSFADKKLADKTLFNVERYYAADSEAEKKLAEIYNAIIGGIKTASVSDIIKKTEGAELHDEYTENGEKVFAIGYETDMGASKTAEVKFKLSSLIEFRYNEETQKLSYKISEWKVITDSSLIYGENGLGVWMPDFGEVEE